MNAIDFVKRELQILGHPEPSAWTGYMVDVDTAKATDKEMRHHVNRALNTYVGVGGELKNVNSTDARYYLVNDCSRSEWENYLKQKVLSFIVDNDIV